jgi:hypothetical protein
MLICGEMMKVSSYFMAFLKVNIQNRMLEIVVTFVKNVLGDLVKLVKVERENAMGNDTVNESSNARETIEPTSASADRSLHEEMPTAKRPFTMDLQRSGN